MIGVGKGFQTLEGFAGVHELVTCRSRKPAVSSPVDNRPPVGRTQYQHSLTNQPQLCVHCVAQACLMCSGAPSRRAPWTLTRMLSTQLDARSWTRSSLASLTGTQVGVWVGVSVQAGAQAAPVMGGWLFTGHCRKGVVTCITWPCVVLPVQAPSCRLCGVPMLV